MTKPVAPEPSAQDAAGFANSADGSTDAVIPLHRGSTFPVLRVVIVVLIAAMSVASPALGSFTVAFAVAIMALGIGRGAGRAFTAACIVGSALLACIAVAESDRGNNLADPGFGTWVFVALVAGLLVGFLGREQWRAAQPDPADSVVDVTVTTEGDYWPEPRANRGLSYALYTWLVAAIVLFAVIGVGIGHAALSDALESTVRAGFVEYDKACEPGGILASDEATCEQFDSTRDYLVDAARDHAPSVLALFLALAAVSSAALAHLLTVTRARALAKQHWQIGVRPAYKLRQLELHWSWAYVALVGVVTLIIARELDGLVQEWTFAAGAGLTAVAGQVIAMHGAGSVAWAFTRRKLPWWYHALLVILVLFAWPFVLGMLVVTGALDMQLRLRRRVKSATTAR